jgi:acetyl esterase/lipase
MAHVMGAAPKPGDLPDLASVSDSTIPGPHGPIPVRLYRPRGEPKATIVYFHGGGWVLGDLDTGDGICRRWAGWAQVEVLGSRLVQSQKAMAVASATPDRKLAASLS